MKICSKRRNDGFTKHWLHVLLCICICATFCLSEYNWNTLVFMVVKRLNVKKKKKNLSQYILLLFVASAGQIMLQSLLTKCQHDPWKSASLRHITLPGFKRRCASGQRPASVRVRMLPRAHVSLGEQKPDACKMKAEGEDQTNQSWQSSWLGFKPFLMQTHTAAMPNHSPLLGVHEHSNFHPHTHSEETGV